VSTLLDGLRAYEPFTALVVGDFMLDQQLFGAAERLSPDAPVPVLSAERSEDQPGGAANVALCLKGLNADVHCFGIVGDDTEASRLRNALEDAGCRTGGLVTDSSRPTTIKRSLIGLAQHRHPQKMFRVDFESRSPISSELCDSMFDQIAGVIDQVDVICLEDYDKGVCNEEVCRRLIQLGRDHGKPILVDPAAIDDYSKYRGATVLTPNRSEAELATGLDTPIDATELHNAGLATRLLEMLELDAVVLTLDRHGALLEERNGSALLVPTVVRSVYDVSGAGDMVLAALAAGISNGLSWADSVRLANVAAGLEVQAFGVQPIALASVHREVLAQERSLQGKIRDLDSLEVELAVHRETGARIVFTNGCFDVIHAGHVAYLREARSVGDMLVVAVNSDEQVQAQKGVNRPVYNIGERLDILSELQCIDYLVEFSDPTVEKLLQRLRPDIYVKGGDYRPEQINEYDLVQELGVELRILAHRPGLSSTSVIERIAAEKVER
jgi:D-beta-D-heptose 7-phosphate kinase/D-beta-D-heptose 1-phosphate adenosyltransferase